MVGVGARLIGGAGRWLGVAAAGSGMEDSLPAVAVPCGRGIGVTAAPSAGSNRRCFGSTRSSGLVTAGGVLADPARKFQGFLGVALHSGELAEFRFAVLEVAPEGFLIVGPEDEVFEIGI